MNKIAVLIPAREGSKGLKYKNIQKIKNKTLIDISILQARAIFGSCADIYVSTESDLIKDAVKEVCCFIDRPNILAIDEARTIDVIKHTFDNDRHSYQYICLLQCDNPFRNIHDIIKQLPDFFKCDLDSAFTGKFYDGFIWTEEAKQLVHSGRIRRQEKERLFLEDGAFYIFKKSVVNEDDFIFGNKYLIENKNLHIDIHTQEDLDLANKLSDFIEW